MIDPALKGEASAKVVFAKAFVRSTTPASSQSLTKPTATDATPTATQTCPYEKFDTHFHKGFSMTCLSLLCMSSRFSTSIEAYGFYVVVSLV